LAKLKARKMSGGNAPSPYAKATGDKSEKRKKNICVFHAFIITWLSLESKRNKKRAQICAPTFPDSGQNRFAIFPE
jgi:hypothetical protein